MSDNKKPNLVWIISDQHRFCDTGYNGNRYVETPFLDRLYECGASFTNAYSSCPLCVPARGSLLTGLHALRHGAAANDIPIKPDCESIADVLNRADYETAFIGKWHLGGTPRDAFVQHYNRLGFQYWRANNCNHDYLNGYYDDNNNMRFSLEGYSPIGETDLALKYIETDRQKDKPFGIFINYSIPHDPYYRLLDGDLDYFLEKKPELRANCSPSLREDEIHFIPYEPDKMLAGYYAHIKHLDEEISRIYQKLDDMGELSNTIFLYSSDHGDMLGSHGFLNKQIYFEESAHVPMIISWKGHIPAGRRSTPIGLVDLAPTVLGLIGLGFEGEVDGEDLSKVLLNKDCEMSRYAYFYNYAPCHQASKRNQFSWRAIADGRYVLIVDDDGQKIGFYDLEKDPYQLCNIAGENDSANDEERMLKALNSLVEKNDGYLNWVDLFNKHNLMEAMLESERYFSNVYPTHFQYYTNQT